MKTLGKERKISAKCSGQSTLLVGLLWVLFPAYE
jgi:hypothetical protein